MLVAHFVSNALAAVHGSVTHDCLSCVAVHAVAEYVLEFQKCLDRTDPIPYSTIRGIMQQELKGRSLESIFSYVNPEPLASASVAQVGALHHHLCACVCRLAQQC